MSCAAPLMRRVGSLILAEAAAIEGNDTAVFSGHFHDRICICAAAVLGPIAAAYTVWVVDGRKAAAAAAVFVVEVVFALFFLVISAMALREEVAGRAATTAAFFGDFIDDGMGSDRA